MFGINLTFTEVIDLAILVLFPVLLWAVYKVEHYREKKEVDRLMAESYYDY